MKCGGPLPIGRERPYQTRRGGPGRTRPTMGSRAPVSSKSQVPPALPAQPLHLRPPPNVCTSIKAAGRTLRAGRGRGGGRGPAPELARVRTSPRACRAAHDAPQVPPRSASTPGFRGCAILKSHRDAHLRLGRMSSVPRQRAKRTARLKGAAVSLLRRPSPPPGSVPSRHVPRAAALQGAPRTPPTMDQPTWRPPFSQPSPVWKAEPHDPSRPVGGSRAQTGK